MKLNVAEKLTKLVTKGTILSAVNEFNKLMTSKSECAGKLFCKQGKVGKDQRQDT